MSLYHNVLCGYWCLDAFNRLSLHGLLEWVFVFVVQLGQIKEIFLTSRAYVVSTPAVPSCVWHIHATLLKTGYPKPTSRPMLV